MRRQINKVAVLGSGVMGSRIACHFANAGTPVLLLDLPNTALSQKDEEKGRQPKHPSVRNRIVNEALATTLKTNPSPVFSKKTVELIQTGNLEDDLHNIADCDWIIEVVTENLEIKKQLYEKVEKYRNKGTLITTNTSGIPIHLLAKDRTEDFQQYFCGTHFFNPPRYLPLLEIIPTKTTLPEVIRFLTYFGTVFLGKDAVLCKDTPAFIANRIGVFSMMLVFKLMEQFNLTIDEVDVLTGTLIGHPKSATFRTSDVVGIDTLVKVADNILESCPDDAYRDWFKVPSFVRRLVEEGRLGAKTGSGFYKKEKTKEGSQILTLDIASNTYQPKRKPKLPELAPVKAEDDLQRRLQLLFELKSPAGDFFRLFHYHLFAYVSHRVPEITDELYRIDEAMKAGFGWQMGPFETWDLFGLTPVIRSMEERKITVAAWVSDLAKEKAATFYKYSNGTRLFYNQKNEQFEKVPGTDTFILLDAYADHKIWNNKACTLTDLGDGIVCLDWQTKMNTVGSEVLEGINKAINIAEKDFEGLLLGTRSSNFSAGANVALIFMMAIEQEWEELNLAVKMFQDTSMRIRYSSIPVIAAPHELTLGGGCEFSLHSDAVQAAAETYMGLVETGLGIIPAGGGTKEFVQRASDSYRKGEIELPILQQRFLTIAMAKTSTSAEEAFQYGLLQNGKDHYSMNSKGVLADAKRRLKNMILSGYTPPTRRKDIKVLGREGLGALLIGIHTMKTGHYISDHDVKVAKKLAYVMCGGDLSSPTEVNEQYLLDLEREAFISLCGEQKTLERIQGLLKTGKIIRN